MNTPRRNSKRPKSAKPIAQTPRRVVPLRYRDEPFNGVVVSTTVRMPGGSIYVARLTHDRETVRRLVLDAARNALHGGGQN